MLSEKDFKITDYFIQENQGRSRQKKEKEIKISNREFNPLKRI